MADGNERKRSDDYCDVTAAAIAAIASAMADGDRSGKKVGSWMKESDHISRAATHLREYEAEGREADVTHLICRAAMEFARLRKLKRELE